MPGAMTSRTVQIHLNRHCNLACAHCYSQSGPREREQLAPDDVIHFLDEARTQGYSNVAFSGGEPFLYPHFETVLDSAEALGMRRLVVTNGTVLMGGRERLIDRFDMIAVSVDGPEDIHNQLRRSPTAYARMCKGLEMLRVMRSGRVTSLCIARKWGACVLATSWWMPRPVKPSLPTMRCGWRRAFMW